MINTLQFNMTDDEGRRFAVSFYSVNKDCNYLMKVEHNGLPIDIVFLSKYDKQLANNINSLMESTALDYYAKKEVSHV